MANVELYQPFDLYHLPVFYGDVPVADAQTIIVESGYNRAIYGGSFWYVGNDVYGTLNTVSLTIGNTPILFASGIGQPANPVYNFVQAGQAVAAFEVALNGFDFVQGSSGNDVISAFAGDDTLQGGFGDDQLFGGYGADTLFSNPGQDRLEGNQGNDTLFGGQGEDGLFGGQDHDFLYGNLGVDALYGNMGNDWMHGGQGNDYLHGGQGDDTLNGGLHDDVLQGGFGADTFVFSRGGGNDAVVDLSFDQGDRLDFEGQSYTVSNSDGSAVLNLEGGGTVILYGVSPAQVTDFFLAA